MSESQNEKREEMVDNATPVLQGDGFSGTDGPKHDVPLSDWAIRQIETLNLGAHPEGGWFRRTWQSPVAAERDGSDSLPRPAASLIYFLLPAGDFSEWHQVDADELWLWHGPGQLTLEFGGTGTAPQPQLRVVLGEGLAPSDGASLGSLNQAVAQAVIPAGVWQRTVPTDHDVLASCVVSPGFVFSGFTLEDTADAES